MYNPLLTTKLYIPRQRSTQYLVPRPRLMARLNEVLDNELTLISAPAGFGKTTLLAQWIPQSDRGVCWLSLDEADNDLTRFLTYFIAALQVLQADFGQAILAALQSPTPPAIESLMTALVNEITHGLAEFALVLDDYHLIHLPAIHTAIAFLLNNLPPHMHLILTSRADPTLPLARLRARRQLSEIRAADLRFTPHEAAAFLNEVMGLSLSAEDIAALETRTEGWIAGLQLAALSMQGRHDLTAFIQAFTGSHVYVVDYLTEEVLQRQPESVQTFLLQTSILERLSGPLCDVITGRSDGQAMLEQLQQHNLFIIPLDNERRWYRYHHLFADLLGARLHQTYLPEQIITLHRRAAEWYETHNFVDDAIHHALKGHDTERVVRLVAANAARLLAQGQTATLQGWLDVLPAEIIADHPTLSLSQAWRWLLRRRLQSVEPYLQAAEQALQGADPDRQAHGQGEIAAIRAFTAYEQGQTAPAIDLARRALTLLPEDNLFARGTSALALGATLLALGDTGPAVMALAESITLGRAAGNVMGALYSLGTLVIALKVQGRLRRAEQVVQEAFEWVADRNWLQFPPAAALYIRLGDIRREQNDLTAAEQLLTQAVQVAQFGAPLLIARAQAFLARVKQTQGDADAAAALLQQVTQICQSWETGDEVAYFTAYCLRIVLRQGRLAEAAAWAEQLPVWTAAESPTYFREFELVTLARVRLAQAMTQPDAPHLAEALSLLAWLREQAVAAERQGIVIETLILEALAWSAQSDISQALSLLDQALTLAAPEGYIRIFIDEGEPLANLLAQLPPTPYRDQLLAAFPSPEAQSVSPPTVLPIKNPAQEAARPPADAPPAVPASLVEPLSERELEVLRLMADGYSNREIAETLVFTLATAKKHAENIYDKLGVHSRTQAIARARELNLL